MKQSVIIGDSYRCRQHGVVMAQYSHVTLAGGPAMVTLTADIQGPTLYGGTVLEDVTFDGFGVAGNGCVSRWISHTMPPTRAIRRPPLSGPLMGAGCETRRSSWVVLRPPAPGRL